MTMLQEQAVRMIQDMSDEKMRAFKELVATRYEAKKYLPDDFDPDAELEARIFSSDIS